MSDDAFALVDDEGTVVTKVEPIGGGPQLVGLRRGLGFIRGIHQVRRHAA